MLPGVSEPWRGGERTKPWGDHRGPSTLIAPADRRQAGPHRVARSCVDRVKGVGPESGGTAPRGDEGRGVRVETVGRILTIRRLHDSRVEPTAPFHEGISDDALVCAGCRHGCRGDHPQPPAGTRRRRGDQPEGWASSHGRDRRREATRAICRSRFRHPPRPSRAGPASREGERGGPDRAGLVAVGRSRPDRVLHIRAASRRAGQGAGPEVWRGGGLDRDPVGQGFGLPYQRRRLCGHEQPRHPGGDPNRCGPLPGRAQRPGPAADRECRDRGAEPLRGPGAAEAAPAEGPEVQPRRPGEPRGPERGGGRLRDRQPARVGAERLAGDHQHATGTSRAWSICRPTRQSTPAIRVARCSTSRAR